MQVGRTRGTSHRLSGALCLATMLMAGTLALTGCASGAQPTAGGGATDCGTSHTAANVPVEVTVEHGQVSCAVALAVENDYAKAIRAGKVQGNGGGAPVLVGGWTCQGFPTPELLKTGNTSKCVKSGTEILAILQPPA
jgi:hypothetical protein